MTLGVKEIQEVTVVPLGIEISSGDAGLELERTAESEVTNDSVSEQWTVFSAHEERNWAAQGSKKDTCEHAEVWR